MYAGKQKAGSLAMSAEPQTIRDRAHSLKVFLEARQSDWWLTVDMCISAACSLMRSSATPLGVGRLPWPAFCSQVRCCDCAPRHMHESVIHYVDEPEVHADVGRINV